jgi:hypothetical protein
VHLGELRLARAPVVVTVSTAELDGANRPVPLPGATVAVTGVWRRLADLGGAPAIPDLLGLSAGLSAARPSGATVDVPTLTLPPEAERILVAGVAPGESELIVSRRGSVVPGDLVALDRLDPGRAEYVEVAAVQGPADPESPARLELRHPLRHGHAAYVPVARVVAPGPILAPVALSAAAVAGAATVELASPAVLVPGAVVRISGGAAAPEYRIADRYAITTNSDGIGHLPPLTGYVAAKVTASSAALGATAKVTLTHPNPSLDLTLT